MAHVGGVDFPQVDIAMQFGMYARDTKYMNANGVSHTLSTETVDVKDDDAEDMMSMMMMMMI